MSSVVWLHYVTPGLGWLHCLHPVKGEREGSLWLGEGSHEVEV